MNKEMREVVKALRDQGFEVRVTSRQHVQVLKDGKVVGIFAGTASDHRSFRNSLAYLRRAGFRWPPGR